MCVFLVLFSENGPAGFLSLNLKALLQRPHLLQSAFRLRCAKLPISKLTSVRLSLTRCRHRPTFCCKMQQENERIFLRKNIRLIITFIEPMNTKSYFCHNSICDGSCPIPLLSRSCCLKYIGLKSKSNFALEIRYLQHFTMVSKRAVQCMVCYVGIYLYQ